MFNVGRYLRKFAFITVTVLLLTLIFSSTVFAEAGEGETANDLFRLYNKEFANEADRLQKEYNAAKKEYDSLAKDVQDAESFNKFYETAEEYQEGKKLEIDTRINELMQQNNELSLEIGSSLSGGLDTLMQLDAAYKINLDEINSLLAEGEKYALTKKAAIDYELLDSLKGEIDDMQAEYEKSTKVSILGEVLDVKIPLGEDSYITSPYGDRVDPVTKTSIRHHAGLDFKADMDTEVQALFHGTVAGTGYSPLGGYFVRIDHGNGIISYYCHLNEIRCVTGQKVSQYEAIALSGNSGSRTTGPHLHLGLYLNGNSVDPGVLFQGKGE